MLSLGSKVQSRQWATDRLGMNAASGGSMNPQVVVDRDL